MPVGSPRAVLKEFPETYTERGRLVEEEERDARLDTPIFIGQLSFPGMPTVLHFFEPRQVSPPLCPSSFRSIHHVLGSSCSC